MNKTEKAEIIATFAEKFENTSSLYLIDYTGITVEEVNQLRREFRKSNVEYKIVKNTLAKRAIDVAKKFDKLKDYLVGMTSIAISSDDPVAPAKIIKKYKEKFNKLDLKACYIESSFYEGSRLGEIASLQTKPEIIASILGSLQSPISGIVGTINAVMRDLVGVIDAIANKKESN
ncbi:MAG: 50S ribosomal protein L10 [Bacteroidetes bacterium]|nr:50S ribosomal protein L10 [Bacteroidota bacterium]MBU2585908.1 50S ribosomal protein L10 [Bacteroidota bacterium]